MATVRAGGDGALPRSVTVVCQRHGADTQLVEGPEGGQAAVHGVAPLHTDQATDAAPPTGEQQLCTNSTNTTQCIRHCKRELVFPS